MPDLRSPTVRTPIVSFVNDWPNLCSLAGLVCAVLGIYFAMVGLFVPTMIALLWATVFDWSDGIIARRIADRTGEQRAFGTQFDSLIDIVSFNVLPAILLLSYGNFNGAFVPGAILIVAAGALRLSYFNVFGLLDGSSYTGLAVDNNAIAVTFLFVFNEALSYSVFVTLLYILIVGLAVMNVANIRTPKLTGGRWYCALVVYSITLSLVFGSRAL